MTSYVLSGPKWGNATYGTTGGTIQWSFATQNWGGYAFKGVLSDPAYQQLIRDAFSVWTAVANVNFVEVADTAASLLRLGWDTIDGPSNTLGEATWQSRSSDGGRPSIVSAEIRFDTAETWTTSKTATGGTLTNFYTTAVHEIGHALGLDHTTDKTQIMYAFANDQVALGTGDIAGIQALYGARSFAATNGNDTFTLTTGNDTIDGLAGRDTAIFSTVRAGVTVAKSGATLTVTGQGTDVLTSMERLQFSDGTLAFDTDANAGQAYRIYQAAFARTPDTGGLSFWIKSMDGGTSLISVAQGFVNSAEFSTVYGGSPTNSAFVSQLYRNVLGREGEAGGVTFWEGQLSSGSSKAQVLASFSESPENFAKVAPAINDGIWYV